MDAAWKLSVSPDSVVEEGTEAVGLCFDRGDQQSVSTFWRRQGIQSGPLMWPVWGGVIVIVGNIWSPFFVVLCARCLTCIISFYS
jgi:hypothetical protein